MLSVRRLSPGDWRIFREIRLAALEDAPHAYSSTLAEWQGENDSEQRWRKRLTDVPLNVVAYLDGVAAGVVGGTSLNDGLSIELISMWVAYERNGFVDAGLSAEKHGPPERRMIFTFEN